MKKLPLVAIPLVLFALLVIFLFQGSLLATYIFRLHMFYPFHFFSQFRWHIFFVVFRQQ